MENDGASNKLAERRLKNMYKNDSPRLKAKIYHKLRTIYLAKLHSNKNHLSLYKSFRHAQGRRKKNKLSCKQYMTKIVNPSAGIGDQLASWISGYYYAKQFGLIYAYEPMFPKKWNTFLGFEDGEIKAVDLLKQKYKKVWLPYFSEEDKEQVYLIRRILNSYRGEKVIFYIEISQVYGKQFGVMEAIQKKFYNSEARKSDCIKYNGNFINIAVHVRRGDILIGQVDKESELSMRWLENNYYEKILLEVLKSLTGKHIKIYLFSQGVKTDFEEFNQFENVEYCLSMSTMDSFLHMVKSDILITSKSSFSYKPALLSEGIKICPREFWHGYPNDSKWILADNSGNISNEGLSQLRSEINKMEK